MNDKYYWKLLQVFISYKICLSRLVVDGNRFVTCWRNPAWVRIPPQALVRWSSV